MKNLLLTLSMLLLLKVNPCAAQDTDFNKPIVHASKQSYSNNSVSHRKYINNINNHIYKTKDSNPPKNAIQPKLSDKRYDKVLVAQIFYDTFPDARLKKLAAEDLDLQINYDIDLQGNILEISFGFADNTSLKPAEIEKLESRLKKEVKFTLNAKVFEGYTYIHINSFVNFKRLVNHTTDAVQ